MKLTTQQRNGLDTASFALPGRKYPIEDKNHARNALARAAQHASPAEQATIQRKVKAKYPSISVGGTPVKKYADGGEVNQDEQASQTPQPQTPDPKILGNGAAANAAQKLRSRKQQLEDALKEAGA